MKRKKYLEKQENFYLLLMSSAIISAIIFGGFYLITGSKELIFTSVGAIILFIVLVAISFISKNLIFHFRVSIVAVLLAIYFQTFFTGGINSSVLFEFIIPPLLAFFYRPVKDRYFFIIISFFSLLSFLPLSLLGYTPDYIPSDLLIAHDFICGVFVFLVVIVFSVLFRTAIVAKNEKLGSSMKELQETTQKLIQSEKMASLGVLSAGVAHEINNPLNFIRGGIEMLDEDLKRNKDSSTEQYIVAVKEGLNRAATIVNSLGHFSRQTEAMNEQCDIHSILDNCLVMLQPKLKYKGTVIKNYDTLPAVIPGNEGKLHQAFLNMISNAEHAIEEDGKIELTTKVQPKKMMVIIKDDGIGISKENINRISDPFFTTKPAGVGTGLGLAISYRIIQEHKGEIKVSSVLSKGTKFILSFQRT